MRRFVAVVIAVLAVLPAVAGNIPQGWLSVSSFHEFHVVIPENASEEIRYAAEVFQQCWKGCTREDIGISTEHEGRYNVWLGLDSIKDRFMRPQETDYLDPGGYLIETYVPSTRYRLRGAQKQLIITGADDQGTLNGVFDFFQNHLGVRWLAPGLMHMPRVGRIIRHVDERFDPRFGFREVGYYGLWTGAEAARFRRAHKFEGSFVHGPFGGHTFYALLPPEKYFAEHPEYYSEIGGRRVAARMGIEGAGQLCCARPETAAAVLAELIGLIKADPASADAETLRRRNLVGWHPDKKVWSVSQMDAVNPCQCAHCRILDAREGSPMGSLLTLVNRVAEGIEAAFPDKGYKVHTLAYQHTRKPPKNLRPRDNVIVQLCDIECDFARPLNEPGSAINAAFVEDLAAWSNATENLYIWDYASNFGGPFRPFPNLHVLQRNLQLFDQWGVKGVYEQSWSAEGPPFSEFSALRAYLLSRLLWDPDYPWEDAVDEFLKHYYGPAASSIRAYIDLCQAKVVDEGVYLSCFADVYWVDKAWVEAAQGLFEEALAQEGLSEEERARIERAQVPVQYAALRCPPQVVHDGDKLILERPPGPTLDEFEASVKRLCGDAAGRALPYLEDVREECGGTTPPRHQETPLVAISNERYLLWVAPGLNGAAIRWRDQELGVELLRRFDDFGAAAGTWEDWWSLPGAVEGPVSTQYRVVEQSANAVVLEARTATGLEVRRTMTLAPGSSELEVVLELHNPGETPLDAAVKIHPEFNAQNGDEPEIWLHDAGHWKRVFGDMALDATLWNAQSRAVDQTDCWAFRMEEAGLSVFNRFVPEQVGGLFFYYNRTHSRQQVNLELAAPNAPLAPGERRRLEAHYWTSSAPPNG